MRGNPTLNKISDGLSNTAIFSEWIRGKNQGATQPQNGLHQVYVASIAFAANPLLTILTSCKNSTMIYPSYDHKGMKWLNHNCGEGGCYSHIMTPNLQACLYNGVAPNAGKTIIGASSHHPGGVNVGFLDGSVKFIRDSVAQTTWWAIATRAGHEVVDASSY